MKYQAIVVLSTSLCFLFLFFFSANSKNYEVYVYGNTVTNLVAVDGRGIVFAFALYAASAGAAAVVDCNYAMLPDFLAAVVVLVHVDMADIVAIAIVRSTVVVAVVCFVPV